MYQKTLLSAGPTIVSEEMPTFSSVAIGLWVDVGSKWENAAQAGSSHLLEHLLFKGTKKYSAREIAETIDSIGGQLNAFTSKEYTCFYARVLPQYFPLAMDILLEMFLRPNFTAEDIDREKKIIHEEIKMHEDSPDELIHDLLAETVWSSHPLGRCVLGTKKSVTSLTLEQIYSFFQQHYRPENLVISIAGNITHQQAVKTCEAYFDSSPGTKPKRQSPKMPTFQAGSAAFFRDLEQVHLCLGAPGLSVEDESIYIVDVANSILGGGLSSRLFQRIREEKGIAYSIFSYHTAYQDNGLFAVYVGLSKENTRIGLELIQKELEEILNNFVSDEELERAKRQILGNFLLGLESTTNRMIRLGKQELSLGRWVPLEEVQNKINAVTGQDVLGLCSKLFAKDNLTTVALGPLKKEDLG